MSTACSALSVLDRHSPIFVCLPTAAEETVHFLVPAFFLLLICSSADDGIIHDSRQDLDDPIYEFYRMFHHKSLDRLEIRLDTSVERNKLLGRARIGNLVD